MDTTKLVTGLRFGNIDLLRYLEKVCDRIEKEDPNLHAFVPGTFERRRISDEGAALLRRYPNPEFRPPLFGVPIGVKDIFRADGYPTRCGSDLPPALFDGPEAECVTRLRRAGSIIMGKTVTTEFACFEPGPTRNPHNPEHTPGGSSSGSAAGMARGFFAYAFGTQTAGSISRPAAFCGVVGFKPTYGRIPITGVIPFAPSADHVGVFCGDVADIALIMPVLVDGWKPANGGGSALMPKVGIPGEIYVGQATGNARDIFGKVLVRLEEAGCPVKKPDIFKNIKEINEHHSRLIAGELARVHAAWFAEHKALYRPKTVETIEKGITVSDVELEDLRAGQIRLRGMIEAFMDAEGIDCWACPSALDHAPKGLESTGSPTMNLPWTYSGLPTFSIPLGMDGAGLPHGLQIVGRFGRDETLFRNAEVLSRIVRQERR